MSKSALLHFQIDAEVSADASLHLTLLRIQCMLALISAGMSWQAQRLLIIGKNFRLQPGTGLSFSFRRNERCCRTIALDNATEHLLNRYMEVSGLGLGQFLFPSISDPSQPMSKVAAFAIRKMWRSESEISISPVDFKCGLARYLRASGLIAQAMSLERHLPSRPKITLAEPIKAQLKRSLDKRGPELPPT